MIGKLTGTVDDVTGNTLILDVNGVGYVVMAGARTLASIGGVGEHAALLIETIVREDSMTLYGFADAHEKNWFKTLTGVQGVGPKVCLAILSACTPDQLALAIGAKDHVPLTRADGVGPKLAQRIVNELGGKKMPTALLAPTKTAKVANANTDTNAGVADDAVSALVNLGYGRSEAFAAVNAVISRGEVSDISGVIAKSLQEMAA